MKVDLNPEMVEVARMLEARGVPFVIEDLADFQGDIISSPIQDMTGKVSEDRLADIMLAIYPDY